MLQGIALDRLFDARNANLWNGQRALGMTLGRSALPRTISDAVQHKNQHIVVDWNLHRS
jgi:hypothetical protein